MADEDLPRAGQPFDPAQKLQASWLSWEDVRTLQNALWPEGTTPIPFRFVGGCVRNALLGEPVSDLDLATSLKPDAVMARAQAASLKVLPTGLSHGTVTVLVRGRPFEVTTLRVDVETDGRHAIVAFTEDWEADARRRDFTMNALYADFDGSLFDPVGGLADLAARRVRFIGQADARIEEDALRILRFFRFSAWYGGGAIDPVGLTAATRRAGDVKTLAAERIAVEIKKMLRAPDPCGAVEAMTGAGVFSALGANAPDLPRLRRAVKREKGLALAPETPLPVARFVALFGEAAPALATQWRFSKAEVEGVRRALAVVLPPTDDRKAIRAAVHWQGREAVTRALIAFSDGTEEDLAALIGFLQANEVPAFPLSGQDLLDAGFRPGPEMGRVMKGLEKKWVETDFRLDREALLDLARKTQS